MVLEFVRGFFGLTSSFIRMPIVRADDDDDEEELVDPHFGVKLECSKLPEIVSLQKKYEECNARVRSRKKTKETCEEELHDLVKVLDHCIAKSVFDHLK